MQKKIIAFTRKILEKSPVLFTYSGILLNVVKGKSTTRFVTRQTNITVEGFPRSSNSYLSRVVRYCSATDLIMATHIHSSANILRSLQLGKPTVVLIRHPEDAILSLMSLGLELDQKANRKPREIDFKADFEKYTAFYAPLLKKKSKLILFDFTEVTTDIKKVIATISAKSNLKLNRDFSEETMLKHPSFNTQKHLLPSVNRNKIKEALKYDMELHVGKPYHTIAIDTYKKFLQP